MGWLYKTTNKSMGFALAVSASLAVFLMHATGSRASVIDRPFMRASSVVIVYAATDFEENGGTGPVVVDFTLLDNVASGQEADDIIGVDGVTVVFDNPNSYTPITDGTDANEVLLIENQTSGGILSNVAGFNILDENDTLTKFGLDSNTDVDMQSFFRISRFFVASNAAFDIYAHADTLLTSGDFTSMSLADIRYFLFMQPTIGGANGWGSAAQNPSVGGLGSIPAVNDLGDMSGGPTKVFDGGRRTARIPGSITQQAVAFVPVYFLDTVEPGNRYDFSLGTGTIGANVTYTIYTP
jgi:hypothetical protein